MIEEAENTMSKATDPHPGNNHGNEHPKPTTPAPAGYFTTPEPAPTLGPEPATDPLPDSGAAATVANHSTVTAVKAVRHPVRVGTVVWGAVVLVMGLLIILSTQLNLDLNAGLTAMWLLLGAGVAMLAGGVIDLIRKKHP